MQGGLHSLKANMIQPVKLFNLCAYSCLLTRAVYLPTITRVEFFMFTQESVIIVYLKRLFVLIVL